MNKFIVETSARHAHVNQETLEVLFGKGYQLEAVKELSQPGQYASTAKIEVFGRDKKDPTVWGPSLKLRILGPVRKFNQVEISFTEARQLNIKTLVKESGHIEGSTGCLIRGPKGEVEMKEGVIIAKRHIHMTPEDAEKFGVTNSQIVEVSVDSGNGRKTVFGDTVVRVSPKFALAMHIDTDECNAAAAFGKVFGEIVK